MRGIKIMPPKIDMIGTVWGRLTVISAAENEGNHTRWLCRCSCGTEKIVRTNSLRTGLVKSCGCLAREVARSVNLQHGAAVYHDGKQHRLYRIWKNMKSRCANKNVTCFRMYGGAGISVCGEWAGSFEVFQEWALSSGYNDNLTIDRIDGTMGYSPDNCRWATYTEQCENRKKRKGFTYTRKSGVTITVPAQQ